MTHIIIHREQATQEEYLLQLLSKLLQKDISKELLEKIPDIHILKPEGLSIGIEEVKGLQKEMIYKPFQGQYQIAIIYNSELLTHEAQNAFLKTLEDSPEFTVYILLLNEEKSLLDTILSRGLKHYVKRDGEVGVVEITKPEILSMDLISQFEKIQEVSALDTNQLLNFLKDIQIYFREELRKDIKEGRDVKKNHNDIEIVNTAYERISYNGNKKLVLENMIVQLGK